MRGIKNTILHLVNISCSLFDSFCSESVLLKNYGMLNRTGISNYFLIGSCIMHLRTLAHDSLFLVLPLFSFLFFLFWVNRTLEVECSCKKSVRFCLFIFIIRAPRRCYVFSNHIKSKFFLCKIHILKKLILFWKWPWFIYVSIESSKKQFFFFIGVVTINNFSVALASKSRYITTLPLYLQYFLAISFIVYLR